MRLQERLRRLDETRAALLDRIQGMSPDQLAATPRAGKWSILEIVEHLVLAERMVLRGLPDPSLLVERPRRPGHHVRYLLVVLILKSGIPVRVPSRAMVPKGGRGLGELRQLWDESQEWLRAYAGRLDARGLRKAVFEHPVAGPLTLEQAVRLDQIHVDGHARQIESLRRLLT